MEKITISDKQWFRPEEVAKIIGVHIDTIYRWIRDGNIEAIKTPGGRQIRIHKETIKETIQKNSRISLHKPA